MNRHVLRPSWIAFNNRRSAAVLGAAGAVAVAWASTFALFWQLHLPRWRAIETWRSAAALGAAGVVALALFWQMSGTPSVASGGWVGVEVEAVERTITAEGSLVEASAVTVVAPFEGTIMWRWVQCGAGFSQATVLKKATH